MQKHLHRIRDAIRDAAWNNGGTANTQQWNKYNGREHTF